MSILDGLQKSIDEFVEVEKKLSKQLEENLEKRLVEVVKENKETIGLTAIKWRQYTPYFNDGDSCEFGLAGIFFKLTPEPELRYHGDGNGFFSIYDLDDNHHAIKTLSSIEKAIESIPDSIMRNLFGEHSEVTITETSLTVEEYEDHD